MDLRSLQLSFREKQGNENKNDFAEFVNLLLDNEDCTGNAYSILTQLRHIDEEYAHNICAFHINTEDNNSVFSDFDEKFFRPGLSMFYGKTFAHLGRLCYVVKDIKGVPIGLVSWDSTSDVKYLDSKNFGYKAKATTVFGMEEMSNYYISSEPVFITEGVVCMYYLRSKGFNALSTLGSSVSNYQKEIINRLGHRAVFIVDNDSAGFNFEKAIRYKCKDAKVFYSREAKDIDDTRQISQEVERDLINDLQNVENMFYNFKILGKLK